jgi:pimeloyl-ACP methyl ester carboxylesterase
MGGGKILEKDCGALCEMGAKRTNYITISNIVQPARADKGIAPSPPAINWCFIPCMANGNYSLFLSIERYEHYNPRIGRAELQSLSSRLELFPAPLAFFTSLYLAAGDWHEGQAAPEQKNFRPPEIPAMIFVNQFGPVTPPADGRLMLEQLPNGRLFILDEGGYGEGNF